MTSIESLDSRQKRIVSKVLQELESAMSVPDARLMLETNNSTSKTLLANSDLRPIAFAVKHDSWRAYVYGTLGEILACIVFIFSSLFLILAILYLIAVVVASVLMLQFSGVKLLKYVPTLLEKTERIQSRFKHHRWAARRRRYNTYKKLCTDRRAPILYLRSFSFDIVYDLPPEDARKADERLAEYYEQHGPVIAVAGPNDKGPMLGPTRLYFDDKNWQAGVIHLMSISQLVVIQAGISQGTLWELGIARRLLKPGKLIISVVDASDPNVVDSYYYDFKPYAEVILGCELPKRIRPNLGIGFGKNWKPLPLGSICGGSSFKVAEEDDQSFSTVEETWKPSFPHEILGIKTLITQSHETRYKKCYKCGLGNWHEATTCERCGRVLERV